MRPRSHRPGLIPAHAGKTSRIHRAARVPAAHPRSRGENSSPLTQVYRASGSSPLTRGKRRGGGGHVYGDRLIPAHAGKTHGPPQCLPSRPAHPRSRGENTQEQTPAPDHAGSSPLTRGKHSLTCAFIKRIGQILESLELCASSGSYSLMDAYATDAPQDQARNTGLALPSSRAAS